LLENGDRMQQDSRIKDYTLNSRNSSMYDKITEAINTEFDKFYSNVTSLNESQFPSVLDSSKIGYHLVFDWTNLFVGE
jgi:hypothetical protein